jgi:HlyD family secretion protein
MSTRNNEIAYQDVAKTLALSASSRWFGRLKRLFFWLLVLGAIAAVAWYAVGKTSAKATVQYVTRPVSTGDLKLLVTATGNLEPTNQVDVGSEISGLIEAVEVDADQRVKAGQVLARVNTTKLQAQELQLKAGLEAAQARLLQAQATLAETQSQLARLEHVRELSGGKVPSQQELESGQATVKRAEADQANATAAVSQAQAALDATRTDISKAIIRSPITGVVLKRSIEPGQTVAASFQAPVLFTIAEDLRRMELHVDVDEADVSQVEVGQQATFTVDAYPDRKFTARITKVSFGSQTIDGVVTYEAVLDVRNPQLLLRPGMTATADITVQTVKDVVLVPNAALRFSPMQDQTQKSAGSTSLVGQLMPRPNFRRSSEKTGGQPGGRVQHVYLLRNGQPVPVEVTIGASDGSMTQILEGDVKPGTEVVIESQSSSRSS